MRVLTLEQADEVGGGRRPATWFDGFLISTAGARAATAGAAFVDGVLTGAGVGEVGGPWGVLAGVVIGGAVGLGTYYLITRD